MNDRIAINLKEYQEQQEQLQRIHTGLLQSLRETEQELIATSGAIAALRKLQDDLANQALPIAPPDDVSETENLPDHPYPAPEVLEEERVPAEDPA